MASVMKVKNKNGEVYAYRFRVYCGLDKNGKKEVADKTWQIPEELKGKPRKIEQEAERQKVLFEEECRCCSGPRKMDTFAAYAEYVISLKERDRKISTVVRYKALLKRINSEIGSLKLSEIQAYHLNHLYDKLAEKGANQNTGEGLSAKTIMEHHRLIQLVYEQAIKEGIMNYNAAERATPPVVRRREAECFNAEEIRKILEKLKNEPMKWQCITQLLIHTGARRGEIMGLTWNHIDFNKSSIYICQALLYNNGTTGTYVDTTKTSKNRWVSIPRELTELLLRYREEQDEISEILEDRRVDSGFCFTKEDGGPMHPDAVTDWLGKFAGKYQLPHINPHKFRHTHVSIMLANGASVVDVARRVGHEQVSTTQNIYAHVLDKGTDKAGNIFEEVLKNTE